MNRLLRLLAATVLATVALGLATPARGEDALPPAPQRWVTDGAGFLSPGALQALDDRLQQYEQSTGHQVLVWIAPTAGNFTPEDFASKTFAAWRVGRANIDDGVVLFVFAADRRLRIEVGYGLESKVTDAAAGRILADTIVPRIQADDRDGAIDAGVTALLAVIDGTGASAGDGGSAPNAVDDGGGPQPRGRTLSTGEKIVIGLLVIGFIILLITNPSLALWLLFNLLAGGRGGGGGGGGGGGFSGGGGRSGGGGASGSW